MKRRSVLAWLTSVVALLPPAGAASVDPGSRIQRTTVAEPPTRVRLDNLGTGPQVWSIEWGSPAPVPPRASAYGPPNSSSAPEIISRVGEILGVIDNPEKRNQLAEQWLQYSKQVIAKEQEFREQWLKVQRQQLAQQDQAAQLQREIAELQMRIEELHAQNLRLEQENLQARRQLAERSSGPVPHASAPAPASQ
jgi:hypothetical protein